MSSNNAKLNVEDGPIKKGLHPFINFLYTDIAFDGSAGDSQLVSETYRFQDNSEFSFYRVNSAEVLKNSIPHADLLLALTYTLNSTRESAKVFNSRQIFQIDYNTYLYFEHAYRLPIGAEARTASVAEPHIEGIIISEQQWITLEIFLRWLVEVDPIGFEILRRIGRDGVPADGKLTIKEDLSTFHDSDNLMGRWRNRITDFADSIELNVIIEVEKSMNFTSLLRSECQSMTSYTGSDFFQRFSREKWVHPEDRDDRD